MHDFTGNAHTSGVSCQIAGHVALFLLGDYRCYDTVSRIVSKHRRGHSPTNILEIPMSVAVALRHYTNRMSETSVNLNKRRIDASCRMINTLCSNSYIEIYDGLKYAKYKEKGAIYSWNMHGNRSKNRVFLTDSKVNYKWTMQNW